MLIFLIILLVLDVSLILFLYFKGKNRHVPKITDEEYEEFLKWYYNKYKKE